MSPVLLTTLVGICVVIIYAFFFRDNGRIGNNEVGLELGAPVQHALISPTLPLVARLVNNTDSDVALSSTDPCKIFRYMITRPDGTFIQASGSAPECTAQRPAQDVLPARSVDENIHLIALDPKRFTPGTYILRARYWGYDGDTKFSLVAED